MPTQRQDIHRRLDGSFDLDFYRHKDLMERRAVMADFFSGATTLRKPLVAAAAVVAGVLYAARARWNGPSAAGAGLVEVGLAATAKFMR